MKRFRYEAARADGGVVRGTVNADHGTAAVRLLNERRLTPLLVLEDDATRGGSSLPPRACAVFLDSLSELLDAGIPLDRALGMVRAGRRMEPVIGYVRERVREGLGLSAALEGIGRFPGIAIGLIRAGERTGLASACRAAATELHRAADLTYRLRSALTYPGLLLLVGAGAIAVLVLVVLPRFVALLGDLGATLPLTTRTLLAASAFISSSWGYVVAGGVLGAVLGARALRTTAGQEILLGVPWLGVLTLQLASARAARALAALLETGAPALTALAAAGNAAGNAAVRERIHRAAEGVRQGAGLRDALAAEHAMDSQLLDLAAAGERAGRVPAMLTHGARLAEQEAVRRLDAVVRLLEPGLIIGIGGLVAFVALALLQAVYGLRVS